jgi:hypothetical protein
MCGGNLASIVPLCRQSGRGIPLIQGHVLWICEDCEARAVDLAPLRHATTCSAIAYPSESDYHPRILAKPSFQPDPAFAHHV